jgi:hypothetical protein
MRERAGLDRPGQDGMTGTLRGAAPARAAASRRGFIGSEKLGSSMYAPSPGARAVLPHRASARRSTCPTDSRPEPRPGSGSGSGSGSGKADRPGRSGSSMKSGYAAGSGEMHQ